MTAQILQMPTRAAVDAAWNTYTDLVRRQVDDARLLLDLEHQQDVARAWAGWRDLFLSIDRGPR